MPTDTKAPCWPFSQLALLAQYLRSLGPPIRKAVQAELVRMLSFLSISGPWGKARPGNFNFGVVTGGEDEYSGDGGVGEACSLFRTDAEYPSEMSLVGETRVRHGLTIYNSLNSELAKSGDTDPCLKFVSWKRVELEYVDLQWLAGQGLACYIWMNATLNHTPG